jgi:hypothetical protein
MNRKLDNQVELHSSYENWNSFLTWYTDFRFEHNGYKLYSSVNCFYVVDPLGNISVAYGYPIWKLFSDLSGMPIEEVREKMDQKYL